MIGWGRYCKTQQVKSAIIGDGPRLQVYWLRLKYGAEVEV